MALNLQAQAEDEEIAELKEAFEIFDKNSDGALSATEIGAVLSRLGSDFNLEQIKKIIAKIDTDGNGEIDFDEFLKMMKQKNKRTTYEDDLKEAFRVFDQDGDGTITGAEIQRVFKALGEDIDKVEIDLMISIVDTDGNGEVDFEEFKQMMTQGPT
jgi:calmodulin